MKMKNSMKYMIKVVFVLGLLISSVSMVSAQGVFQSAQEALPAQTAPASSGGLFDGAKQSNTGTKNRLMDEWDDDRFINPENSPIGDGAVALLLLSFGYIAVRAVKSRQSRV